MRNVSLAGSVLMLVIAGTAILASQSGSAGAALSRPLVTKAEYER